MSISLVAPELGGVVGLGLAGPGGTTLAPPDFVDPTPGGFAAAGTLDLPAGPEATAWAEFVRRVTAQPDLRRVGVAFRAWSGAGEVDLVPPTPDVLPWIRFTPAGRDEEPWSLREVLVRIEVHVDAIVPGTSAIDSMNLWSCIRRILGGDDFRRAMRAAGALRVVVRQPAFGAPAHLRSWEPRVAGDITALGAVEIQVVRPL